MKISFYALGEVADDKLEFAVIIATMDNKWVFVRHKERDTWEIPGGHREEGEAIRDTAKRELYEETGAVDYAIQPICEYSVTHNERTRYGRLFLADVKKIEDLPDMEIGEVRLFEGLPEALTYEAIQPYLFQKVLREMTCDYLGKQVQVVMDRPLGSKHPKYEDMIYPINYGYIPDTLSGDGMEIDAYILGEDKPLQTFQGLVIALIKRKDDREYKLVVASDRERYTMEDIRRETAFQEQYFQSEIIMA